MASFMIIANQYIWLVKVLYSKLPTNGKQLPAFPLEFEPGFKLGSQRWEATVLPLCQSGALQTLEVNLNDCIGGLSGLVVCKFAINQYDLTSMVIDTNPGFVIFIQGLV